jgi:hypothetical protein
MGILFVLLFWGMLGAVVALVGGFIARRITVAVTPDQADGPHKSARENAVRFATFLPFACLAWAGAIFVFQADFGQEAPRVNRYFVLDTQTGKHLDFDTEGQLGDAAARSGTQLRLEPVFDVYRRYRFTWFDYIAGVLVIAFPILAAAALLRRIFRIRSRSALEQRA